MKTKSILGALAIVLLSFAACEKTEFATENPAIQKAGMASDKDEASLKMKPHVLFHPQTGEKEVFSYDGAGNLARIASSAGIQKLSYDALGRLVKVETNLTSGAGMKEIAFDYGPTKSARPIGAVEKIKTLHESTSVTRKFLFKFNEAGLKVMEQEFSDDLSAEVKRTEFAYDANNNCIAITKFNDQIKVDEIKMGDYDRSPNALSNIAVLQLLPGKFISRNNARQVTGIDEWEKPWPEKRIFIYAANGWPVKEFADVHGKLVLLTTFTYINVNI